MMVHSLRTLGATGPFAIVVMLFALGLPAQVPAQPGPATTGTTNAGVRESFPITDVDGFLLLPATVAEKEYPFLLDTGTNVTVFDTRLEKKLGKPTGEAYPGPDGCPVKTYAPPRPQGSVARLASGEMVVCTDLTRQREATDLDVYGILGTDCLRGLIIEIDFDRRRVAILARSPPPGPERGDAVPFVWDADGFLRIMGTVGTDVKRAFVIDTACAYNGCLDRSLAADLARSGHFRQIGTSISATFPHEKRESYGQLARLAVGSFEHHDLFFSCSDKNVLGLDYLRRYRVTIDLPRETIYLRKGSQFSRPDRTNMTGLHIVNMEGQLVVDAVGKGSPADLAGIRSNDILLVIQGKPASAYRPRDIGRLISGDAELIRMTVQRGAQRYPLPSA